MLLKSYILRGGGVLNNILADIYYNIDRIPVSGANGCSCDISFQDLNNITSSGFYYGNEITNYPEDKRFGYLIVIGHSSHPEYVTQLFFMQNPYANWFYIRQRSVEWGPWIKFNGEIIS